jgi:multimeric flavodoxin WrbA
MAVGWRAQIARSMWRNRRHNQDFHVTAVASGTRLCGFASPAWLNGPGASEAGKDHRKVKIVGIVGSPRPVGNSYRLIREALSAAAAELAAVDTECLKLADFTISSCRACESCGRPPFRCVLDDDFGAVLDRLSEADGLLLASPRYGPFGALPSRLQALLERLMNVSFLPKHADPDFVPPLHDKPCGLLAVSAEGGQNNLPVLHSLEQYVLAYGMRVVHAPLWPFVGVSGKGNAEGDVLHHTEAIEGAQELGRLVARAV